MIPNQLLQFSRFKIPYCQRQKKKRGREQASRAPASRLAIALSLTIEDKARPPLASEAHREEDRGRPAPIVPPIVRGQRTNSSSASPGLGRSLGIPGAAIGPLSHCQYSQWKLKLQVGGAFHNIRH